MKKKMIALLLVACMMATLMPQAYATSDVSCEEFFCPGEISLALEGTPYAATPERQLNQLESTSMLATVMGWEVIDISLNFELDLSCLGLQTSAATKEATVISSPDSRKLPVTLREFVATHGQLADRADKAPQLLCITADGGAITSRLLGTNFLTEEEATALTESIDKPLTAGIAALLCSRLQRYFSYLYDTDYEKLFTVLLPEYQPILQVVGTDVLHFWLQEESDPDYTEANFISAIHEMTHEYAARQEHAFAGRVLYGEDENPVFGAMVRYSHTPKSYFTGKKIIKVTSLTLPPMSTIAPVIPKELKDYAIYKAYLSGKYLDGTYTLYDALQEYTACVTQMTARTRIGGLSGWSGGFDSYVLAWSYYIQSYFLVLQENYPETWNRLLKDGTIPLVFCETTAAARQQTELMYSINGEDMACSYIDEMLILALAGDQFVSVRAELEAAAAAKEGNQ